MSFFIIISAWISPQLSAEIPSKGGKGFGMPSSQAVLYYHPSCSHCKKVEAYLQKINKSLIMKNVTNPQYQMELKALGQRGVPVLVVGDEVIIGSTPIISYLTNHQEVLR